MSDLSNYNSARKLIREIRQEYHLENAIMNSKFVPPANAPAEALPKSQFLPINASALFQINGGKADYDYPFSRLIRKVIPANYACVYSDIGLSFIMTLLRRYHIPFEVVEDAENIYAFERVREDRGRSFTLQMGTIKFTWKGVNYVALHMPMAADRLPADHNTITLIAGPSLPALRDFVEDLSAYEPDHEGKILVFRGDWEYDADLRRTISHYTWDDLIMDEGMKAEIRSNAENFFYDSGDIYRILGIPRKRGFLFCGDPGSGKSLCAKIIANTIDVAFIYVLSLSSRHTQPDEGIEEIFSKARALAPAIICFEDLDSQLDHASRTIFLNAMDGFQANDGVLTIATTNYPELIDKALTNRPSRFDKKWIFPNPEKELRLNYLMDRVMRLVGGADNLDKKLETTVNTIAANAKEHSFAMLQELIVNAGHVWLIGERRGSLIDELNRAAKETAEQVKLSKGDNMNKAMESKPGKVGFNLG